MKVAHFTLRKACCVWGRCWLALALVAVAPAGWGQVSVVHLNNFSSGQLRAPVYGVDPIDYTICRQGNTPTGIPSNVQTYNGPLLSGTGFMAELWGGPTNVPVTSLQPLGTTVFRTGTAAGLLVDKLVEVRSVPPGMPAQFQLRAWDTLGGTVTSYAVAKCRSWSGYSMPFISEPLGGWDFPPSTLRGLTSFNLYAPLTPEFAYFVSYASYGSFDLVFYGREQVARVMVGESVRMSFTAYIPPFFVWSKDGVTLPGTENNWTLSLPSVRLQDAGFYRVDDGIPDNCLGCISLQLLVQDGPRLRDPRWHPDGRFAMRLEALPNRRVSLQSSSNLVTWTTWHTQELSSASTWFTNSVEPSGDPVFHRAVLAP